ncbi:hypothetical protein HRJ46_19945, partial [Vibrio coralliilyticus]
MIVYKIDWISREAKEATLLIGDGVYECFTFSHPCHFDLGYSLLDPLLALDAKGIRLAEVDKLSISRIGNTFGHDVIGIVSETNPTIVRIGNIKIEIEEQLPMGIKQNDIV